MAGAVERVTLTHLQIPLKEPLRVSGGEVAIKDAILVAVETGHGIGLGECSPMTAGLVDPCDMPERCWDDLALQIAPDLIGWAFGAVEEIAERAEAWAGCSRFAVAGAETACWDLLGQARHATIAELLGASLDQLDRGVESGLSLGLYPTIVELLRAIEAHMDEGYRRVKIRVRPGQDIELVRAVRQHFGEELPLMVDANGAYTSADLDVFRELDGFDLLMFEQPMAADDLDGLIALQKAVATPVCLDETVGRPDKTAEAIRLGACRIVNLKLQRLGGFGPALALHDLCYRHGVACWVGSMPELGVGQAQGIHLAALGNCKYPSDLQPSARWFVDDIVVPLIEHAIPGLLRIPTRPGLGYLIDPAKVRRYQVRHLEVTAPRG